MTPQEQFDTSIADFDSLEPTRSPLYAMGLKLLNAGYEIEAYLLVLATWNFANFRYILTTFDLAAFLQCMKNTDPAIQRLKGHVFQTADIDALAEDIKSVYSQFKDLVGQTGATKILHFKHPGLFVMWDTGIRKHFKIPNTASPDHYVLFLKQMKTEFGHIAWTRQDKTFAKAIDEYNFVMVHGKKKLKGKSRKRA